VASAISHRSRRAAGVDAAAGRSEFQSHCDSALQALDEGAFGLVSIVSHHHRRVWSHSSRGDYGEGAAGLDCGPVEPEHSWMLLGQDLVIDEEAGGMEIVEGFALDLSRLLRRLLEPILRAHPSDRRLRRLGPVSSKPSSKNRRGC